jgi:tungstate transport system substrate-binding protein
LDAWAKLLSLFLVSCLALVMVACGGDDGDSSTAAESSVARSTRSAPEPTEASGEFLLGSTTTTQDTGLLDVLAEEFEKRTGYRVKLIVGGSGQVIEQGSRGDVDALLVHSPAAEEKMVEEGNAVERTLVMHNDFVIIGPPDDPAGVKSASSAAEAFSKIASARSAFISRGDDSGTHVKELAIWKAANTAPAAEAWYEETGQGQAATMQVANQRNAYALTDRGTYLTQQENLDLTILAEGDAALLNVYHAMLVNPANHADVNEAAGRAFIEFITSPDIQALIGQFGVEKFGEPLFTPDAGKPEPSG